MLVTVLIVILILYLLGMLPGGPIQLGWPSGGIGLVLVVILILVLLGKI